MDVYSLGIIFFEMCQEKYDTDMERAETLKSLRMASITFPTDFEKKKQDEARIIRQMLNHDASARPSSEDLVNSEDLPWPEVCCIR